MDETSPVFENFRNKMQAFGLPIRGTTRKVSASKFLGRDDINELKKRVETNEKKITLLKNIIQTQSVTTGAMITSLSQMSTSSIEVIEEEVSGLKKIVASLMQTSPVVGIGEEITGLKEVVGSIKETLIAQEKFEMKKFFETQKMLQNERRRKRESLLEGVGKRAKSFVKSTTNRIVNPVKNLFMGIIQFFMTIFFGRFLIKLLNFFSNPRNVGIVNNIANFIANNFPLILTSITFAGIALAALATKLLGLQGIIALLTGGSFLGTVASGVLTGRAAGGKGTTEVPKTMKRGIDNIDFTRKKPSMFQNRVMKGKSFFNKGGLVPGTGSTDIVPAMLTPGEVVINKPAVQKFGLKNLLTINEAGKFPNKKIVPGQEKFSARPVLKRGITYAQDGGEILQQKMGGFEDIFNQFKSFSEGLPTSEVGKTLSDEELPNLLKSTAHKFKLSDVGKEQIPKDITNLAVGKLLGGLDTSKITKTIEKFKSEDISEKMNKFKSVIKNNIPSPPVETGDDEDEDGFSKLSELMRGMGVPLTEANDFQEDVLAAPLVDSDPLKEAVVMR